MDKTINIADIGWDLKIHLGTKKLSDTAVIPTRGSKYAAGYDLYSCIGAEIQPHCTVKIGTGIAIAIPVGYYGAIYARSGLATKKGLRPSNCVGVVDCDYRGEIIVALHNDTDEPQEINCGDRIAQIVIAPYLDVAFDEVDELSKTERGDGGFGHSGV